MRIFVAGATGVIGRRIIPKLLSDDHQITAVGRTATKRAHLEQWGAKAVEVDLFSTDQVRDAIADHDVVVNLATAIPSTYRLLLPGAWRENDRIRRIASRNLANAAQQEGINRIVQESFVLIYQDQGDTWVDEEMPLSPAPHTQSILAAEEAMRGFTEQGGTGVVLRFGLFYGPDSSQTLEMINLARRGWAALPGPEERYLSSISHDGAATAVISALGAPAGIYNVSDDTPLQWHEYFSALAKELGVSTPKPLPGWTRYLMGSVGETLARSLRISNQKFRHASGWAPIYSSAKEGLEACLAQIKTARDQ